MHAHVNTLIMRKLEHIMRLAEIARVDETAYKLVNGLAIQRDRRTRSRQLLHACHDLEQIRGGSAIAHEEMENGVIILDRRLVDGAECMLEVTKDAEHGFRSGCDAFATRCIEHAAEEVAKAVTTVRSFARGTVHGEVGVELAF